MHKPLLVSSVLRQVSPRKTIGTSFCHVNMFDHLRDASPGPVPRTRVNSVKRKAADGPTYADKVASNVTVASEQLCKKEKLQIEISKVNSICDKVADEIRGDGIDPKMVIIFSFLCDAIRSISKVQGEIVGGDQSENTVSTGDYPREVPNMVSLGAIPKRSRMDNRGAQAGQSSQSSIQQPLPDRQSSQVSQPPPQVMQSRQADYEDPPEQQKFKEAIKLAERSTLVFNLSMGRVPLLNKETMSQKATLALSSMAAEKEGKKGQNKPCDETVSMIDDVLSVATNMSIYGKTSKTYRNPKDPASGTFCTAPVRYEFEDRNTKFEAERVLREKCGVQCTTPYPIIVRECIRQVVTAVKKNFPNGFVKVTVDANNFGLKVARKSPEGSADPGWHYVKRTLQLPREALNVDARRVPDGFIMSDLPRTGTPEKSSRVSDSEFIPGPRSDDYTPGTASESEMDSQSNVE
jgi:hypothetical protein